jgi:hypothetical protein
MKPALVVVVVILCASFASAQDIIPQRRLSRGTWDFAVFGGAGSGIGASSDTQFVNFGFRIGRVLTADRGLGWMRGNFEYAIDVMPLYFVFQDGALVRSRPVYGASINALMMRWNFTRARRRIPFVEFGSGMVWSARNTPPDSGSRFNFTPQLAFGWQTFRGPNRAISVTFKAIHLSNASLAAPNPGYNAIGQVAIGYHWLK